MADAIIVSETPEAQAERIAKDFTTLVSVTLEKQERFTLALAGGQTPKMFYTRLAAEPYRSAIAWEKIWFFWGDERCVPKEHPESNYGMAFEARLSRVPVSSAHVYRFRGEDPPPLAASEYEKKLREVFRETDWPVLDLALLGLGTDCHTASLIPGTPAVVDHAAGTDLERRQGHGDETVPPRWAIHNVVRSMQTVRLTLTLPVLNHAKHVWFLVSGAKKAAAFERAQGEPGPDCPASLIHPDPGELKWYIDQAVKSAGGKINV
jgi:6-phosphogluconolactonase